MKSLWFMPLTFVAGQHGFALFAPYLGVFLAATTIARGRRRRAAPAAASVSIPVAAIAAIG